jgi:hypothetical protein
MELDTIVACRDLNPTADDNHDPVTTSHEHAATTLSKTSSAGNRAVSEPGSPQARDSLRLPQSEALAEGLSKSTLLESSHNPEWPQSSLTPQGPSLQSLPIQYSPSQLSPTESSPSQSQAPSISASDHL